MQPASFCTEGPVGIVLEDGSSWALDQLVFRQVTSSECTLRLQRPWENGYLFDRPDRPPLLWTVDDTGQGVSLEIPSAGPLRGMRPMVKLIDAVVREPLLVTAKLGSNEAQLWDLSDGLRATIRLPDDEMVTWVDVSADGRVLVASEDFVRLYPSDSRTTTGPTLSPSERPSSGDGLHDPIDLESIPD